MILNDVFVFVHALLIPSNTGITLSRLTCAKIKENGLVNAVCLYHAHVNLWLTTFIWTSREQVVFAYLASKQCFAFYFIKIGPANHMLWQFEHQKFSLCFGRVDMIFDMIFE